MGDLYIVATPIGNKDDITLRALQTLKTVDLIACEDSRVSKKLLDSFGINSKLVSYHKFNEKERSEMLIRTLEEGKSVALISDAGMPCISDPGRILVKEVKQTLPETKITCIPGASAVTTFLALTPRTGEEFAFIGFLPRVKNQQEQILTQYKFVDTVFFEAANRLIETINNIKAARGANCKIAIGRELTKLYEEVKTGTPDEIIAYYNNHTLKGEIAGMVYADPKEAADEAELCDKIKALQGLNYSAKDISQILSTLYPISKNAVYKLALKKD